MSSHCIELDIENVVEAYFKAKNKYEKHLKIPSKLNMLRKLIEIMINSSCDFHLILQGPEPVIKTIDGLIRHVTVNHMIRYGVRISLSAEELEVNREKLKGFKAFVQTLIPYIDFKGNPWTIYLYYHPNTTIDEIIAEVEYLLSLKYNFKRSAGECKVKYVRNPYEEYLEDKIIEHVLKAFYSTLRLELKIRLVNENKGNDSSVPRCMFLDRCIEFMDNHDFERFIYLYNNIKFITENYSVNTFMLKLLGKLELLSEFQG